MLWCAIMILSKGTGGKQKMNQREWKAWAHIRNRALECMIDYEDYPGVKVKLDEDLKTIQDLLTKGEVKQGK